MLAPQDRFLAARLNLDRNSAIVFTHFIPNKPSLAAPDAFEYARRRMSTPSLPVLQSLLTSVQLGQRPVLYVFFIATPAHIAQATATLDDLHFDDLTAPLPASHFPFQHIYDSPRHLVSHFLNAVRIRLIDDIVATAGTSTRRCKDGFLISHQQLAMGTDWGAGWAYKALSRPLIFCHLQLQPTRSALVVRPTLLSTPYLPLESCLPLAPRSPISLLPYATPAYFLTTYSGPTSTLARQFSDSLQGLGQPSLDTSYIIGWIGVENKQGEDKGITFIYPTCLCLAFVPSIRRPLLEHTPDLPGPLQPSPKLQSTSTPLSEDPFAYPYRPSLLASPNAELTVFRALTLSRTRNIRTVVAQVSGYVDHVAKDRERERERLKREREGGSAGSPNLLPRATPSGSTLALPPIPSTVSSLPTHTVQPPITSQNFYPSPPQAETSTVPLLGNTSPILPIVSQQHSIQSPASTSALTQIAPPLATSSSSSSYDPFNYLGMNMAEMSMDFGVDIGMSFNISIGMNISTNTNVESGVPGSRSGYNDDSNRGITFDGGSGMGFEELTDDDFNFFDQPSAHVPTTSTPISEQQAGPSGTAVANSMRTTPPLYGGIHLSGPGPPLPLAHMQQVSVTHPPWASSFPEGFTPCSIEQPDPIVPSELVASTPKFTPPGVAEGGPVTPNIHLDQHQRLLDFEQGGNEALMSFDPIPFGGYHRAADGKYGPTGKFGLPSPPPDEPDMPSDMSSTPLSRKSPPRGSEANSGLSWRTQYNAVTDPRVSVMRKLIGVKRKHTIQGGRSDKDVPKSLWTTEFGDWKATHSSCAGDIKDFDAEPSDDENTQSEDGLSEEEGTPVTSRPITPLPPYLPLGSSLLHTHFHHTHLLPLSKPLRPPGASISGPGGHGILEAVVPVVNVPTPVSPAAGLGLTAEKWKALEIVVNILAKEAAENAVWGDVWLANNTISSPDSKPGGQGKKLTEVWASDVKFIENLFDALDGVQGDITVGDFLDRDLVDITLPTSSDTNLQPLQVMHTPKISVSKGDAIINILPTALRFWEKLGLRPKNGEKNASVYALFADDSEEHRRSDIENWLGSVCDAYQSKHLGKLTLGAGPCGTKDGLVPLRFDLSFRKPFANFIINLANASTPILLFLVVPFAFMSLSSPVLRQILSSMSRTLDSRPQDSIFVQLIPEHIINYMENDPACADQLETLCINVYNRIVIPIDRPLAHSLSSSDPPIIPARSYFQGPIFTLARPPFNRVMYTRSAHTSLGVLDRYTLLHVGYRLSNCGKWLSTACIDQRGEAWDQRIWLLRNDQQDVDSESSGCTASTPASASGTGIGTNHDDGGVIKKVWEFIVRFARRADVEWRIVISKLGIVDEAELVAWAEYLPTAVPTCGLGSVHVSLICVNSDNPWVFTKTNHTTTIPRTSKPSNGRHNLFSDVSSTTYALFPSVPLPIVVTPTQTDLGLSQPYVMDPRGNNGTGDHAEGVACTSTVVSDNAPPPIPISPLSSIPSLLRGSCPHSIGLLPESTSCLIRIPHFSPLTSVSMLHIHLLYAYSYPRSPSQNSGALEHKILHADVTKNFYELSVLAQSRWKMTSVSEGDINSGNSGIGGSGSWNIGGYSGSGGKNGVSPILPIHLATVEIMNQVADSAESIEIDF